VEIQRIGPEWISELKELSSTRREEALKAVEKEKADRGDKVSISDEAKLLQKAREIVRRRNPDIDGIRRRLKEGYYDREDVLREVVREVLSELLGL